MNPYHLASITKAAVFDWLLLLMFNVGHQPDKAFTGIVARFLDKYYEEMNNKLLNDTNGSNLNGVTMAGYNRDLTEELDYSQKILMSESQQVDTVQKINEYLEHRMAWKIQKMIALFKSEHRNRFTVRMSEVPMVS